MANIVYTLPFNGKTNAIRSPTMFISSAGRTAATEPTDFSWRPDLSAVANWTGNNLTVQQVTMYNSFYNIVASSSLANGNVDGLYAGLVWALDGHSSNSPTWFALPVTPGSYTYSALAALFTTATMSAVDASITAFAITKAAATERVTITFTYAAAQTVTLLRTQVTDLLGLTNHCRRGPYKLTSTSSTTPSFVGTDMVDMLRLKKVYIKLRFGSPETPLFGVLGKGLQVNNSLTYANITPYYLSGAPGSANTQFSQHIIAAVPMDVAFASLKVYIPDSHEMTCQVKGMESGDWQIQLVDEWGILCENNGMDWNITVHLDVVKQEA